MLVLGRRVGERILIGNQIELVVTAISGNRVRLGVKAPREVPILRSELAFFDIAQEASEQPDTVHGVVRS